MEEGLGYNLPGVLENLEGTSTDRGLFCWVCVVKKLSQKGSQLGHELEFKPG